MRLYQNPKIPNIDWESGYLGLSLDTPATRLYRPSAVALYAAVCDAILLRKIRIAFWDRAISARASIRPLRGYIAPLRGLYTPPFATLFCCAKYASPFGLGLSRLEPRYARYAAISPPLLGALYAAVCDAILLRKIRIARFAMAIAIKDQSSGAK